MNQKVNKNKNSSNSLLFGRWPQTKNEDFKLPWDVVRRLEPLERLLPESRRSRLVALERRVGGRPRRRGLGLRLHPDVEVNGNGVLTDLNEAGVDDLAVDLHHGHVVGGIWNETLACSSFGAKIKEESYSNKVTVDFRDKFFKNKVLELQIQVLKARVK